MVLILKFLLTFSKLNKVFYYSPGANSVELVAEYTKYIHLLSMAGEKIEVIESILRKAKELAHRYFGKESDEYRELQQFSIV
jgi:hypothetical protein